MAIPKRGTRKISVDGRAYRWFARADIDCCNKSFLIVSIDDDRYRVTGGFYYEYDFVISPSIIEQAIRQAKEGGWEPGKSDLKILNVDTSKIRIRTTAKWVPALFDNEQSLMLGNIKSYYFNESSGLQFSWGPFDINNDFRASCSIDKISHPEYGEISEIRSLGSNFVIVCQYGEKTLIVIFKTKVKFAVCVCKLNLVSI
ncbi:hypothetical protein A9Q99_23740 [Gammaproteobacteria bacterium 45_16_T64]|nr:hypothetical protein A9Q99_23740 [Gammaproteobacteria bacterium 45_16_T64]